MLKDEEIKLIVEGLVVNRPVTFQQVGALIIHYIKERRGVDAFLDVISITLSPDLVQIAIYAMTDYYAEKFSMAVLLDKNKKIIKIIWEV